MQVSLNFEQLYNLQFQSHLIYLLPNVQYDVIILLVMDLLQIVQKICNMAKIGTLQWWQGVGSAEKCGITYKHNFIDLPPSSHLSQFSRQEEKIERVGVVASAIPVTYK